MISGYLLARLSICLPLSPQFVELIIKNPLLCFFDPFDRRFSVECVIQIFVGLDTRRPVYLGAVHQEHRRQTAVIDIKTDVNFVNAVKFFNLGKFSQRADRPPRFIMRRHCLDCICRNDCVRSFERPFRDRFNRRLHFFKFRYQLIHAKKVEIDLVTLF